MRKTEQEINAEKALKSRPDLVPGGAFLRCITSRPQSNSWGGSIYAIFGPQGPSIERCAALFLWCKSRQSFQKLPETVTELGKVMAYGRNKHGHCTWRIAGTEQAEPETHWASACRHVCEYLADLEAVEEGSGLPVLLHAMTQCVITMDLLLDPPTSNPSGSAKP